MNKDTVPSDEGVTPNIDYILSKGSEGCGHRDCDCLTKVYDQCPLDLNYDEYDQLMLVLTTMWNIVPETKNKYYTLTTSLLIMMEMEDTHKNYKDVIETVVTLTKSERFPLKFGSVTMS
jgi:hypothetical protein